MQLLTVQHRLTSRTVPSSDHTHKGERKIKEYCWTPVVYTSIVEHQLFIPVLLNTDCSCKYCWTPIIYISVVEHGCLYQCFWTPVIHTQLFVPVSLNTNCLYKYCWTRLFIPALWNTVVYTGIIEHQLLIPILLNTSCLYRYRSPVVYTGFLEHQLLRPVLCCPVPTAWLLQKTVGKTTSHILKTVVELPKRRVYQIYIRHGQFQWPRLWWILSLTTRTVGSRVRIPLEAWMFPRFSILCWPV
jgi:hypothetical protein